MAPGTNAVAYVDKNNIYYRSDPEDETNDIRITSDGVSGRIYNGVPDWVYEGKLSGLCNYISSKIFLSLNEKVAGTRG